MNKLFSTLLLCMMCIMANATVFTWTGSRNESWFDNRNWTVDGVQAATYPKDAASDDVLIPAGLSRYPVLALNNSAKPTCHFIHFQITLQGNHTANTVAGDKTRQSARLQNQHLLVYTEAFCDIDITANRWVRMTSPLLDTYTGDFFVAHQTTNKSAWSSATPNYPFVENHYEGNEAKDHPGDYTNRSHWSTYASFYSDYYTLVNDYNTYDVNTPVSEWGNPVNGLGTEIKPAVSFDVWVNNGSTTADHDNDAVTFHFPSSDTEYQYYNTSGNLARRDPATNLNRTHKGKFALSAAEGKWELKQAAAASMFAVGNPAFAYLDIAEFIKYNTKNMSPFVYKHVEELDGRGYEQIYWCDLQLTNSGDLNTELYRVNTKYVHNSHDADVAPEENKSNKIVKTDRAAYINPAEGFRVMGGSVGFSCDEPGLVGVFNNSASTPTTYTIASAVRNQYYNGSNRNSNGPSSLAITMLQSENVGFGFSITTTDRSDYVRLNNFLNRGSVEARIEKNLSESGKGKLVIPAGQPLLAAFKGPNTNWNGGKERDADFWMYEDNKDGDFVTTVEGKSYGVSSPNNTSITLSSNSEVDYTGASARTIKYRLLKLYGTMDAWKTDGETTTVGYPMSNPIFGNPGFSSKNIVSGLNTCDIELNYEIAADGTVSLSLKNGMRMFIASDAYMAANSIVKPAINEVVTSHGDNRLVDDVLCEAWFAYDGMTAHKKNLTGEGFIFEECIGKYSTFVRQNFGRLKVKNAAGQEVDMIDHGEYSQDKYKHEITIQPVLGSYNTVGVLGLYPEDAKTMVMGQIEIASENVESVENVYFLYVFKIGERRKTTTTYKMFIPAGQLAHVSGSSINPAFDHYFYSHGSSGDMIKTVELTWNITRTITTYQGIARWFARDTDVNANDKKWTQITTSDNNACYEAMIARQGIQPIVGKEEYDGLVLGELNGLKNYFNMKQLESTVLDQTEDEAVIKPGSGQQYGITLNYAAEMFVANPDIRSNSQPSYAPARNDNNGAPAFISASIDGITATSMVVVRDRAKNGYHRREDAPLFDVQAGSFTFGTLAGTHLVGVNAINELDTLPLFLSKSATLQFSNINSLADEVYLYDAVANTSVLVENETDYPVVIEEGQQAGRYFLIGIYEAPTIETDIEDVQAEGFSWKPVAYCPASGSLSVSCADEAVRFELYNLNGQKLGESRGANTFQGLSKGAYIVNAIRGGEQQGLKVIVY